MLTATLRGALLDLRGALRRVPPANPNQERPVRCEESGSGRFAQSCGAGLPLATLFSLGEAENRTNAAHAVNNGAPSTGARKLRSSNMSEFVYLYREASMPAAPQAMQERMVKWLAWFNDLEKNGHMVDKGHPLTRTGGGVVKDKKGNLTDGPYAETKDIVIGYTVIEATDFEQAVLLSTGCPLLDDGGLVEVRPIMKL